MKKPVAGLLCLTSPGVDSQMYITHAIEPKEVNDIILRRTINNQVSYYNGLEMSDYHMTLTELKNMHSFVIPFNTPKEAIYKSMYAFINWEEGKLFLNKKLIEGITCTYEEFTTIPFYSNAFIIKLAGKGYIETLIVKLRILEFSGLLLDYSINAAKKMIIIILKNTIQI